MNGLALMQRGLEGGRLRWKEGGEIEKQKGRKET